MPIAWKNSSTSSGVGAAPTLTADRPRRARASRAGREASPRRPGARAAASSSGTCSPACSSAHLLARGGERPLSACSRSLLGAARDHRLEARLQLLPDARDGEEPGRPHLRQVGDDLARVRAGRDRDAVARSAGSGGRRARRCAPPAARRSTRAPVGEVDRRSSTACDRAPCRLRCVSCTPFGGPGRARRVDQRQQVVRLDGAPRRSASKSGFGPRRSASAIVPSGAVAVDARSRARAPAASLRASRNGSRNACSTIATSRARVADDVGDLLGREASGRSRTASRRASSPRGRRGGTRAGWRASARPCRRARRRAARGRRRARRRARAAAPR